MRISPFVSACLMLASCTGESEHRTGDDAPRTLKTTTRPNPFDESAPDGPLSVESPDVEAAPSDVAPSVVPSDMTTDTGDYGACDDGKRVCGDMSDCEDAYVHLRQCGMSRLDRDRDGVPCESICGHN